MIEANELPFSIGIGVVPVGVGSAVLSAVFGLVDKGAFLSLDCIGASSECPGCSTRVVEGVALWEASCSVVGAGVWEVGGAGGVSARCLAGCDAPGTRGLAVGLKPLPVFFFIIELIVAVGDHQS